MFQVFIRSFAATYSRASANRAPTSASFGVINPSTQANYARRTQVMVKFLF